MLRRLSDRMFNLKRVGKYLTDSDLRKAYKDYKESEEIASRLILNTLLSKGWLEFLSQPQSLNELVSEFNYTNVQLLDQILDFLVNNKLIGKQNNLYVIKTIKASPLPPKESWSVLTHFYSDAARFLPNALKNDQIEINTLPRIILEAVFESPLVYIGREVLLRNFAPDSSRVIGVAAFADVSLSSTIAQINTIFDPEIIHLFLHDYRWASSLLSLLRLQGDSEVLKKISIHLIGALSSDEGLSNRLDLFFGEEFFAFNPDMIEQKAKMIASCLKPGGRVITDDPTMDEKSEISAAYILMQVIKGYPQPIDRSRLKTIFEAADLKIKTVGDNWLVARFEGGS